jgi:L-amino acid N-acyltransferase YncA
VTDPSQKTELTIRRAVLEDCPAVASLHVRAWQWAYRGQLPEAALQSLSSSEEQREVWWRELVERSGAERLFVALRGNELVGFISTAPSRETDADNWAELGAIYLEEGVTRQGIGKALQEIALSELKQRRFSEVMMWVLKSNDRGRFFFEATGWQLDGQIKSEPWKDVQLEQVRYRRPLS